MLDLYTPSTEQFIADYYTRADRVESRRSKLKYTTFALAILLPLFIATSVFITQSNNPKETYAHLSGDHRSERGYRSKWMGWWHGPSQPIAAPAEVIQVKPTLVESIRRFPGDPNPIVTGKSYWGSSIGGNGDPSRHETPAGTSLSIRRTFWQWSDAGTMPKGGMYKTVETDLAANRLPFISIKTPGWKEMADGKHDAELDKILKQLDSYGKPVWFAVHHEPEGGGGHNAPDDAGGPSEWRRMQVKVRQRMNAIGTKNIAFMPILMSYTWNPASGRTPDDWWVDGIWDAYCVDHYQEKESGDMFSSQWTSFVKWAEAKKMPFCIAEWGNRGTDSAAADDMQAFWDWTFQNKKDLVGYAYFDSGLNSPSGSWELKGKPLVRFQDILKNDTRVQRINDL